jgi:hypothetical protein
MADIVSAIITGIQAQKVQVGGSGVDSLAIRSTLGAVVLGVINGETLTVKLLSIDTDSTLELATIDVLDTLLVDVVKAGPQMFWIEVCEAESEDVVGEGLSDPSSEGLYILLEEVCAPDLGACRCLPGAMPSKKAMEDIGVVQAKSGDR